MLMKTEIKIQYETPDSQIRILSNESTFAQSGGDFNIPGFNPGSFNF